MKVCPECGAVYDGRRWIPGPCEKKKSAGRSEKPGRKVCPGCLMVRKRQVEGVVTLKGEFLGDHRGEIEKVVKRVARNRGRRSVTARVIKMERDNNTLVIETTDEHLAERMGKEVFKAFKGDLDIKWQERDHFVRVVWQRD